MRPTRPSMQELIGRRKRAGFVGRRAEIDRFRGNFDVPPDDERHSFVFHVHGTGGVGKSSLLRELKQVAADCGAATAMLDETVHSVPDAMAAISAQLASIGRELKALDKMLSAYRQRRHEAEAVAGEQEAEPGAAPGPSAGSMVAAQAGLIGLGMVPGVGAFAGALDSTQVAHRTDQLRALLSARFRNHDDVQLLLEPLRVLTPVFLAELNRIAESTPGIALFFDTYERTGTFLDGWLLDVITTGRYGTLPANVVVTLAGRHGPDPARWGDYAGFVTEFPLEPFTESEARQLLAAKGVRDEGVVQEVLRLSDRLPLLVSTLGEQPGGTPGEVDDPAATAVERFLKWERNPVRREAALACAFPRHLDEDVFRVVVKDEAESSYAWLRELPFVSERASGTRYHDVVRTAMLRLQRNRAPRPWAERHASLAEAFGGWREDAADGLANDELWLDETWRELRTAELYHLLCARPRPALSQALADVVEACHTDPVAARACAQALADAGTDAGAGEVEAWGRELLDVLSREGDGVLAVADLLLNRPGLEASARAEAHGLRGRELLREARYDRALDEYDRALALDPRSARAHYGRGVTHGALGDAAAALADLERAEELRPDATWIIDEYALTLQRLGRHDDVVAACDRVIALEPVHAMAWAVRAYSRFEMGDAEGALRDFDRALGIDEDYLWALVHRAEVYRGQGALEESFADLDRAAELAPDNAWIASERGDAYRIVERYEEAERELGRACVLDPDHASAHAGRGYALAELHRHAEAMAAYDQAIELEPEYGWALVHRAELRGELGDKEGQFADLDRAVAADDSGWILEARSMAHHDAGHHEEALADADRLAELPGHDLDPTVLQAGPLQALGRFAEAEALLDQALARDPDNLYFLVERASARTSRGRYAEALDDMDRALALDPDQAGLYQARLGVGMVLGRVSQSLADAERFVACGGDPVLGARYTALLLTLSGRHDEACRLLDGLGAKGEQEEDWELVQLCWYTAAAAGSWDQASRSALWMRDHADETKRQAGAALLSALVRGSASEFLPFEPLFMSYRQAATNAVPDAWLGTNPLLIHSARGEWSAVDKELGGFLARVHDWLPLATLANLLGILARCPGIDGTRIAPRIAALEAARDAAQARYAE
ncbi:ATP-binding protein [Streptomyces muensis]|uniref:Tetratricopeptide repeat protein n=1 Tax=Streptomyces muensis TaxID=1077944 RepID=A0A9X1Q4Z9_STRM4|nr:ATP-binding protein [Streptomyces muensis]MCF1597989.1 tetratricopeptide repeat protein [Streptomyces muensis]